ncbi:acid protease, partial [Aureobasidium melanogenum]
MSWFEPLELAIKLYNDGDKEGCVAQVDSILTDALSPYPRMRCHILLGHALDNWCEAETARFRAENYLAHWRLHRPAAGTPARARRERLEKEIRDLLDDLAEELRSWRPDDWYEHQLFWTEADAQERNVAIGEALKEWYGEQVEGEEEEEAAEEAEGEEENIVKQAEGEGEEGVKQAEDDEENTVKQTEGETEKIAEQAEGEDEKVAEQVEDEEEVAAEQSEGMVATNALRKEVDDAFERVTHLSRLELKKGSCFRGFIISGTINGNLRSKASGAGGGRGLRTLNSSESLIALIEDGVDRAQADVTQNIERHVATALDTAVGHAVSSISKAEGILVDGVLVITDGNSDNRKRRSSSVEALRVVDRGVVDGLAVSDGSVDVAECVEAVLAALDSREVSGEQFSILGDIILAYHAFDGGTDGCRLDCVDGAPSQAQQTIASALDELSRDLVGDFDSLVLNCQTANGDNVSTDSTACRRLVSVGDLPSAALRVLPGAALGWVKDGVASLNALRLSALIETAMVRITKGQMNQCRSRGVVLLVLSCDLALMTSAEILLHQNVLLFRVSFIAHLAANVSSELAGQNGLAELLDNIADEVRSIEKRW